jgi:hypothetical protein
MRSAERLAHCGISHNNLEATIPEYLLHRADAQGVCFDRRPDQAESISFRR